MLLENNAEHISIHLAALRTFENQKRWQNPKVKKILIKVTIPPTPSYLQALRTFENLKS